VPEPVPAAPAGNAPLGLVAADPGRAGAPHPANAGSSRSTVGVALNQDLGAFGPAAPAGPGLRGVGAPPAAAATPDPGGPAPADGARPAPLSPPPPPRAPGARRAGAAPAGLRPPPPSPPAATPPAGTAAPGAPAAVTPYAATRAADAFFALLPASERRWAGL